MKSVRHWHFSPKSAKRNNNDVMKGMLKHRHSGGDKFHIEDKREWLGYGRTKKELIAWLKSHFPRPLGRRKWGSM